MISILIILARPPLEGLSGQKIKEFISAFQLNKIGGNRASNSKSGKKIYLR